MSGIKNTGSIARRVSIAMCMLFKNEYDRYFCSVNVRYNNSSQRAVNPRLIAAAASTSSRS